MEKLITIIIKLGRTYGGKEWENAKKRQQKKGNKKNLKKKNKLKINLKNKINESIKKAEQKDDCNKCTGLAIHAFCQLAKVKTHCY